MDVETRNKVVDVIKESCSLRSVLKPTKLCPYFGVSKSCLSCSYDWNTIAEEVAKAIGRRVVAYEREKERRKAAEAYVEKIRVGIRTILDIARDKEEGVVKAEAEKGAEEDGEQTRS